MSEAAFAPPERFDEFRVIRVLGEGAMGQVFLCADETLQRQVAVKFLKAVEMEARRRERFLNEARAIARLTHANVVTVYRIGQVSGVPYIASEFIEGQSLDKLPLPGISSPRNRKIPSAAEKRGAWGELNFCG